MIYPTASEILACVDHALFDASDDSLSRAAVKSTLVTCRHLVRHAELRVQLEPDILRDDIEQTTGLIEQLAAYLDAAGSANKARGALALLAETVPACATTREEPEIIRQRAKALREQVYAMLKQLQAAGAAEKTSAAYQQARRLIREYIKYEIEQEARTIDPAFRGHGPRR